MYKSLNYWSFMSVQHLPHIEDVIWSESRNVFEDVIEIFSIFNHSIASETASIADAYKMLDARHKIDGSLAILIGTHPETGKFTVTTKHKGIPDFTNLEDIKAYTFPHSNIQKILISVFESYKNVELPLYYQADVIATPESIVRVDDKAPTSQPNIITYQLVDSLLIEESRTKAVIAPHTTVDENNHPYATTSSLNATFKNTPTLIDNRILEISKSDILYESSFNVTYQKLYELLMLSVEKIDWLKHADMLKLPKFKAYINQAINSAYRKLAEPKRDAFSVVTQEVLLQLYQADIDKVKTKSAKENAEKRLSEIVEWLEINKQHFCTFSEVYVTIQTLKFLLLNDVSERAKMSDIAPLTDVSLLQVDDSQCPANTMHEGMVVTAPVSQQTYKLVNREVFSRLNFLLFETLKERNA